MKKILLLVLISVSSGCTVMPALRVDNRVYCERHPYYNYFYCPDGSVHDANQIKYNNVNWIVEQSRDPR